MVPYWSKWIVRVFIHLIMNMYWKAFQLLNDERIYSYGINRYVFMGGAHGLSNVNYFNFDLRTGKKSLKKSYSKMIMQQNCRS